MSKNAQTLKIWVVDDEAVLCHGVKRILDGFSSEVPDLSLNVSYALKTFGSAEEVVTALSDQSEKNSEKPDLILLDYKLPGMSGLEALQILDAPARDILVIMVTAYANLETAIRATKLGAYDFLAKPFTPDELRYVVKKASSHLILARQARRLEEDKRKIRFEFLSVLAHELKAPLNAVQGYLELLQDSTDGDSRQMVDRSLIRVDGMRKLIFDLLDLTRIESGQKSRNLVACDFGAIIRSSVEAVSHEAKARGIGFNLDLPSSCMIQGDASELEIISNNLISNAVKYNRDAGSVKIQLLRDKEENGWIFAVSDTGIGIAPEDQAKLFKEFVRIRNEHTMKILGSGLGLSTVKKLATLYGGAVDMQSREGEGTTFTVSLKDFSDVKSATTAGSN